MELEEGIFGDGCCEGSKVFLAVLVESVHVSFEVNYAARVVGRQLTPQKK